ncbi:MAG: PLP-dependent aminotransferase family protein [Formosimonas sp.]
MNNDTIFSSTPLYGGADAVAKGLDPRLNKVDQVVAWLTERVQMRFYAPGVRVPSVRALADKLGVSRFTIVHAYDKLVAAGVLASKAGSGFYVASAPSVSAAQSSLLREVDEASVPDATWLLRHVFSDVPDEMSPGSGLLPHAWLENERVGVAVRSVTRSCENHLYGYGHVQGYAKLREQMVVQLHHIGMVAKPEHMVCTQGVSAAIDLIARYLLKSGDTVLVDDPSWFWLYGSLQAQGLRVIGVPRDTDGPNIEILSRLLAHDKPKLYVTNSVLHNPTSFGLSPARAYQVLRLLDEHDCYILEDDIYGDFHGGVAKGAPALRYAALDQFKRVFYVAGFSKSLAAGLRVAVLCCPEAHVNGVIGQKMLTGLSSPELNEAIVYRLLVDGQHRRHLEKLRTKIANAHERLRVELPKIGLAYPPLTQDGLFIWLDTGVDTNALAISAMSEGWLIAPGGLFSPQQGVSTFMRINVTRCSDAFLQWLGRYLGA